MESTAIPIAVTNRKSDKEKKSTLRNYRREVVISYCIINTT